MPALDRLPHPTRQMPHRAYKLNNAACVSLCRRPGDWCAVFRVNVARSSLSTGRKSHVRHRRLYERCHL